MKVINGLKCSRMAAFDINSVRYDDIKTVMLLDKIIKTGVIIIIVR
jgi:hypothetical protein